MTSVEYPEQGNEWCAAVEDNSWWFQHRSKFLLEVMRRFPPPTPLYDVGGGNGIVASALKTAGIRSIVVEPGQAGARRAKERGLDALCTTLEGAGLPPASVPSIGMFDVLEHIEAPNAFLQHARTLLKPGGRIYVAVPAYDALWSAEDVYAHHFRRYTRRSLRAALQIAGFDVEFTTYMFAFLPLPILLMRSIPYRFGRARPFTEEGARADHTASNSPSRALVQRLLGIELRAFRRLGSLPFGASVVAVGKSKE